MDKKTLLLTSGCSFSDSKFAWPHQLSEKCDFNIENIALPSQGHSVEGFEDTEKLTPNSFGHEKFTTEMIIPFLKNLHNI